MDEEDLQGVHQAMLEREEELWRTLQRVARNQATEEDVFRVAAFCGMQGRVRDYIYNAGGKHGNHRTAE